MYNFNLEPKKMQEKTIVSTYPCAGRAARGKTRLLAVIEEPPVRVVLCRNGISTGLCFLAPLESLPCPIIIGDLLVWGTLLFTGRANGGDWGV